MQRLLFHILFLLFFLYVTCSINPSDYAGGSTDEVEAKIIGTVVDENLQPVESTVVVLKSIQIDQSGVNVLSEVSTYTKADGAFSITIVNNGKYVLLCKHKNGTLSAIVSKIAIHNDTLYSVDNVILKPGITVKGRILTETGEINNNLKVFLPGIVNAAKPDLNGFYTFTNIPQGYYDISFVYEDIVNYLPVTVDNTGSNDTIFIKDASFATEVKDADNIYSFYPHVMQKTFSIVPKRYTIDNRPQWYTGRDFSHVQYYEIVDQEIMPIWRFSFLAGVTEETVNHYGGMDAIKILIENQVDQVNAGFNEHDIFNGTFEFYVDSVYQFSGAGGDEIYVPFQGFDYRVIYDGFPQGNIPYWYQEEKTIYHGYAVGKVGGLYGTESTEDIVFDFGLSRGCLALSWLNVYADSNTVNHESFKAIESIMHNSHGVKIWDEYSVNIINFNTGKVTTEIDSIRTNAFPASFGVSVVSGLNEPVSGVEVNLYGVKWASYKVSTPPVLSGTTDGNGDFNFPENPFLSNTTGQLEYLNFLVSCIKGIDTVCTWLPVYTVSNSWFVNPDTVYKTVVQF